MAKCASGKVLLLTVGTGDIERQQETLIDPLIKSMRAGEFARIVLLPSHVTSETAERLRTLLGDLTIEVAPLPRRGDEQDLAACHAHYLRVLGTLAAEGEAETGMCVDFTRGTKVMGAALVLAAVQRGVETLRYITAERGPGGVILPGTETIHDLCGATLAGTSPAESDFANPQDEEN
jgi:hypothetical protein